MAKFRWSNANRLLYIAKIVDKRLSFPFLDPTLTKDDLQRIIFLADKSDEFLELNKDNYRDVLEG